MGYQQPAPSRVRTFPRSPWRGYSWRDPAQIAANQQGIMTPEQCALLDKGPGCFAALVCVLFVFAMLTSCGAVVAAGYTLFTGNLTLLVSPPVVIRFVIPFVLAFVLGNLWSVLRKAHKARFRQAVSTLMVEREQGEIVWEHEQYIAHTANFRLKMPPRCPPLPPPGPYHFYFVAGQNILLSAQPIHTFTQALAQPGTLAATGLPGDEQARLALQLALCSTLGFSLADLDANRNGVLNSGQHSKFSRKVFWYMLGSLIGLLICGGLFLLIVVAFFVGWLKIPTTTEFLFVGCVALAMLVGFLASLYGLTAGAAKRWAEISRGQPQSIAGHIQTHVEVGTEDSPSTYYYDIGQLRFEVSYGAYKALMSDVLYRVYYLASSKTLVSVEALEAPGR